MENQPIEVEFKFPVDSLEAIRSKLESLGATSIDSCIQQDEYLNDPLRDFAKLDIALRIRQVDDQYWLTFKGPNLDPDAKIRREIETSLLNQQAAEELRDTFLSIGFYSVATVSKKRECMSLVWQHLLVEASLDEVDEVGPFVELEILVHHEAEVEGAKNCLQSLSAELELVNSTRTSYLAMLLKNRGQL
ncbi:MAG: class IV adenylate cyclase [Planctomycetota bacterium]